MKGTVLDRVTLLPGGGLPVLEGARVTIDGDGVVTEVVAGRPPSSLLLLPAAVDLHLDNLQERRRPRATVQLDPPGVVAALDAECAAAGIGVVCFAARCEDAPARGFVASDAVTVARAIEELAPHLACDWRVHARVEVTDDGAVDALTGVLAASSRVALVSMMEHSERRTRFASVEEHRRFYAEDWGLSVERVDEILAAKRAGTAVADDRRREIAVLAAQAGVVLASHDDRTAEDVEAACALGASVAEFPLSLDAARRARELGMWTVLGAPNAVHGQSTSPGNLLAAEAAAAGVCDVLCSDYLPASLQCAPFALAASGVADLRRGVDLVAAAPAAAIGLEPPVIRPGRPLTAALATRKAGIHVGLALWRDGRLVYQRTGVARSVGSGRRAVAPG